MIKGLSRNVAILSLTLIVVSLGFGLVIPVFPFLIADLGGGGMELGLLVAVAALTELVFGPLWGGVSDRIGRKPVLALGMFGYAVSLVLFGIASEIWMLFLFRGLSGVLTAATASSAMAYIGDSIPKEERGGGMGILGAAGGLGLILRRRRWRRSRRTPGRGPRSGPRPLQSAAAAVRLG